MAERTVTLLNDEGLHARPAGVFVKQASQFKSTVEIRVDGVSKNAKSIMNLMGMGLEKGAQMTIVAKGEDEAQAVDALSKLVENKFAV